VSSMETGRGGHDRLTKGDGDGRGGRRRRGELRGGSDRGWRGGRGGGGGVGVPGWGCVELIIFRCLSWRPQT